MLDMGFESSIRDIVEQSGKCSYCMWY
jgi:hypothetical protein